MYSSKSLSIPDNIKLGLISLPCMHVGVWMITAIKYIATLLGKFIFFFLLLFIYLFLSLLLLSFFSFYPMGSTIYQKITLSTNKNSANNFIAAWEILRVCVWSLVQFNLHAEYCICKIGLKLPGKLLRFVVRFHFFFFRLKVGVLWYLIRLECTFMCVCARLDLIQQTYVN